MLQFRCTRRANKPLGLLVPEEVNDGYFDTDQWQDPVRDESEHASSKGYQIRSCSPGGKTY